MDDMNKHVATSVRATLTEENMQAIRQMIREELHAIKMEVGREVARQFRIAAPKVDLDVYEGE